MLQGSSVVSSEDSVNYAITNSLKFRAAGTTYLSRTFGTPTNNLKWTWSGWVKRGCNFGSIQGIFDSYVNNATFTSLFFHVDNTLYFYTVTNASGSTVDYGFKTNAVFRDASAWYHIVLIYDSANSTADDRIIIYVNGVRQTGTTPDGALILNVVPTINTSGVAHSLGRRVDGSYYFDGNQAEVNFVDGQALPATNFGEYNGSTGVWQPKRYTGTYGNNGFYLPFKQDRTLRNGLYFNGSTQYLTVADNAALEFGSSNFCVELNYANYSATGNHYIVNKMPDGITPTAWEILKAGNQIQFYASSNGSTWDIINGAVLGTIEAAVEYHIAVWRNGTTFYGALNGKIVTLGTSSASIVNNTSSVNIGAAGNGVNKQTSIISNLRIVTGSSVYGTTNFYPPQSALTAITGTQLLINPTTNSIVDESPNAFTITNNGSMAVSNATAPYNGQFACDNSGNFNHWSSSGLVNAFYSYNYNFDLSNDSPTISRQGGFYNTNYVANTQPIGNYAILNPLSTSSPASITNAGLSVSTGTTAIVMNFFSSIAMPAGQGKWYCEVFITTGSDATIIGVCPATFTNNTGRFDTVSGGIGYYGNNGNVYYNSLTAAYGASYTTGDVIGIALDMTTNTLTFYKNGVSQGNLAGASYNMTSGVDYYFVTSDASSGTGINQSWNFGQRPFAYTAPAGYQALCTTNLPNPTILRGNKYMDATLYTGTGSTQSITNAAGFRPDLVWTKSRIKLFPRTESAAA